MNQEIENNVIFNFGSLKSCYSPKKQKNKVKLPDKPINMTVTTTQSPAVAPKKVKKKWIPTQKNCFQTFTVYEPENKVEVDETVDNCTETDYNVYLNFTEKLFSSFKIIAGNCHKNPIVYRVKNKRNEAKGLQTIFVVKKQIYCVENEHEVVISETNTNIQEKSSPHQNKLTKEYGTSVTVRQKETVNNSKFPLQSSEKSSKKKKDKNNKKNVMFPNYWSFNEVENGLQNGELIKGILRINPKNYKEAYVSNKDRSKQDYVIDSLLDRNRALEGDVVALKLKPKEEWKEKQQTAIVVYILEMVHPRKAVGYLKLPPENKSKKFAVFCPRDNRIPRMQIASNDWPPLFAKDPSRYEETLFLAKIISWNNVNYAVGSIIENVGTSFNLIVETKALLLENELDVSPFPPEALQHVPKQTDISEEDLCNRKDLRNECIFTIDPLTARDLDDAVSCKELENGNYLVGVHISDVAYYLKESTILDEIVSKKATSIYLVDNVFHMLPTEMCLHCSLLPGKDKLSFSVLWEMTSEGEILKTEYTRSVINSCAQLAYEHAQKIIENPDEEICDDGAPTIHNGFKWNDLKKVVTALYEISLNLRRKRFENGALQINQPKVMFRLDPISMAPTEWFVYENKEAHRLIEEFMLLANISVAERLVQYYPDKAFLRCHDPPVRHMLEDLQKTMKAVDVHLDISSSGDIQSSLRAHVSNDYAGMAKMVVLNNLLAKPMTRARYFCAEDGQDSAEFYHYALSIPLYTHFTSPIRRYADIIVHRLLAASLGYTETPQWRRENVIQLAANCNKQKYNAKRAGEASCDLFFAHYVETHQPFIQDAVVCDVKDRSFDVIVIATGTNVRIYEDSFNEKITWTFAEEDSKKQISIIYPETQEQEEFTYVIKIFTVVKVALKRKAKTHKLEGTLLRPVNQIIIHRSY